MDIYSILASKPHNSHYLNRYITFIERCQQKNVDYEGYTEDHHICPKADDMFPEYDDFRLQPWNCAVLTARQHFIAHFILWKAFPNKRSCSEAIWFMSNGKWKQYSNYSKLYEKFREEYIRNRKREVSVKDKNGNIFRVLSTDSRWQAGELVGHTKGMITAENISGERIYAKINDPRVLSGEYQYISKNMLPAKNSIGEIFYIRNDDPRYLSGELMPITKNQVTVRNDQGQTFNVDKNDEKYILGEYKHISTGYVVVKDKYGNTNKVKTDDPRWLSREFVGINEGYFPVKDIYGNTSRIRNDDPRYLSGELMPLSKGRKHEKYTCQYCASKSSKANTTKWHNENCKLNPDNPNNSIGFIELIECPHCLFRPQTSNSNSRRNFKVNHLDNCPNKI